MYLIHLFIVYTPNLFIVYRVRFVWSFDINSLIAVFSSILMLVGVVVRGRN